MNVLNLIKEIDPEYKRCAFCGRLIHKSKMYLSIVREGFSCDNILECEFHKGPKDECDKPDQRDRSRLHKM